MFQYNTMYCSIYQCITKYYSALRFIAACFCISHCITVDLCQLQCIAVQYMYYSIFQSITIYYSVLIATNYRVFQYITLY